jgi:hypothetical protein
MEFTIKDVFTAYKKLKHYYYYDNTTLFIREKIADFEYELFDGKSIEEIENTDRKAIYNAFLPILNFVNSDEKAIRKAIAKKISYRITPKSFHQINNDIITNEPNKGPFNVERLNVFIDADIEIHIMSVLWLMHVGRHLVKYVKNNNYAYILELLDEEEDSTKVVDGLRLYKPYFIQYQQWRDNALKKANHLLDEKKDVCILSLDIKEYFYSVKFDLNYWKENFYKTNRKKAVDPVVEKCFFFIQEINSCFTQKVGEILKLPKLSKSKKETILPIGLLSSGLLGNLHLSAFDEKVKDALNPSYYGRYVDDLLFVFADRKIDHNKISIVNDFLDRYFVKRGLLKVSDAKKRKKSDININDIIKKNVKDKTLKDKIFEIEYLRKGEQEVQYYISGEGLEHLESLFIQSSKVKFEYFNHKESRAAINNFKKNLDKNRSEFRFLPDEDSVESEFDDEAFSIQYSDSVNKLRSMKEFSEDKYGASKYLAKKIFATKLTGVAEKDKHDKKDEDTSGKQILNFFKGHTSLKFYVLWEKVFLYFLINERYSDLKTFYKQSVYAINQIDAKNLSEKYTLDAKKRNYLKEDLKHYLDTSFSVSLAAFGIDKIYKINYKDISTLEIINRSVSIRMSNMFRHNVITMPAINYSKLLFNENYDLNNVNYSNSSGEDFKTIEVLALLSPRYVHFHELNVLKLYETIVDINDVNLRDANKRINKIPENAFSAFYKLNHSWRVLFDEKSAESSKNDEENLRKLFFTVEKEMETAQKDATVINKVEFSATDNYDTDKKIALANIKVNETDILKSINGKSNTSRSRRKNIFKLINVAVKEKCDLFVLPEVSVPFDWVSFLAFQSYRSNLGIVAGLEHFINKSKFAFNFMVTVLPIKRRDYTTCLIRVRLKNHYSHEEKHLLKGYRLIVPSELTPRLEKSYDLFHWRNIYFSVYNCFELADIEDRALFKSRVDFVIASQFNKDTSYFSEIAGSWPRDLHCFFIQVNTSHFGDSRLVQPASSAVKNLIVIKGGENSSVIVGIMPIKHLREFQLKEYHLQKDDIKEGKTKLKPTPPDFDRGNVLKRINNK